MASARQIHVGGVPIGGGAPVAVQTMTKTETANLPATMEQIRTVADAGADIVRVAVPREQDAQALKSNANGLMLVAPELQSRLQVTYARWNSSTTIIGTWPEYFPMYNHTLTAVRATIMIS